MTFTIQRYAKQPALLKKLSTDSTTPKQRRLLKKTDKVDTSIIKMQSILGASGKVVQAVESGDIDSAIIAFNKQAFATITALIPIAERAYKEDPRQSNAYAMSTMISAARELAQDLAASNDRAALAENILREMLEPMMKSLVQYYLQQSVLFKTFLTDKVPSNRHAVICAQLNQDARAFVEYMQIVYKTTADSMREVIQGEQ